MSRTENSTKVLKKLLSPTRRTLKSKGNVCSLPKSAAFFVRHWTHICKPGGIFICDGTDAESEDIAKTWVHTRIVKRVGQRLSGLLFRTSPKDTGNALKSKTFFVAPTDDESTPLTNNVGVAKELTIDQWKGLEEKFKSSMEGRKMFVIPFLVGPEDKSLAGVLLTDCPYVYMVMKIEVRVSATVWKQLESDLNGGSFIRWVHSMGRPRPTMELVRNHWPCNPTEAFLAYHTRELRIETYGSGVIDPTTYLFPMMLQHFLDTTDCWVVATFSILAIRTPHGREFFIAMATADGCDETIKMAESKPSLRGYDIKLIATNRMTYLWVDDAGVLRAVNPMIGFSDNGNSRYNEKNTPALMKALRFSHSLFLNTALKNNTDFFWDGMEPISRDDAITDWQGLAWSPKVGGDHTNCEVDRSGGGGKMAHPNNRFYCLYSRYSLVHPKWTDPSGVPISAIIFGAKRTPDVPLMFECRSWVRGILTGACLKTDTYTGRSNASPNDRIEHRDPMATHGLIQENTLKNYIQRWLNMGSLLNPKRPRIFHVNWWTKETLHDGKIVGHETWPGMAESTRLLDWILRRCDDHEDIVTATPLGYLPRLGTINMSGLNSIELEPLLRVRKNFWLDEFRKDREFLEHQVGTGVLQNLLLALKNQEAELADATEEDLDLNPKPCSRKVPDKCFPCLGPPFKTKTCKCSK